MGLFDKFKNVFSKNKQEDLNDYKKGLEKTRNEFVNKISLLNGKYKKVSDEYFEELEEIFIMADIGVNTVMKFIDKLKKRVKSENITDSKDLMDIIVDEMFIIYVNNDIIVKNILNQVYFLFKQNSNIFYHIYKSNLNIIKKIFNILNC